MGILNGTIADGATVSASGGTQKTYTPDGLKVNNGVHTIDATVADARIRPSITCRSFPAAVNANGKWTDDRREITITRPKILADGSQKFPAIFMKMKVHPENTQAEIDALCNMAAQALIDADYASFWRSGSLA